MTTTIGWQRVTSCVYLHEKNPVNVSLDHEPNDPKISGVYASVVSARFPTSQVVGGRADNDGVFVFSVQSANETIRNGSVSPLESLLDHDT